MFKCILRRFEYMFLKALKPLTFCVDEFISTLEISNTQSIEIERMQIVKHKFCLIVITVGLYFLSSDGCSSQSIDTNGLVSSVRLVNGEPALFVNGRQKSLILAAPYRQGPRDFNTFRAGGIEIFNFYLRFPWTGPDQWDFSPPDAKLDETN